jgi:hypothetical protein
MKTIQKIAAVLTAGALVLGAAACSGPSEYEQRKADQKTSQITNSLEKQNLEKKRDKEEDPNAIRYVYILSYANIIGFYTAKGKISSSASQVGPETEVIKHYGEGFILDSAKDDGTYGPGDPGIFFFTTDGVMVETSLDYIVADQPLPVDVPRFSK